ncbi:MAG TPA: VCBS repeat-containing protein [bacterium]|nr:VCBS repeat-containing protein [bacterium]
MFRPSATTLLVLLFLTPAGHAQDQLWELTGTPASSTTLGSTLTNVGDIDGDGVSDLAAGTTEGGFVSPLEVLSGADGSVLFQGSAAFYTRAAAAGDVNNDGVADFIVGSAEGVTVRRGPGGAKLFDLTDLFLGPGVLGIGDVNADGHDDLAVSGFENLAPGFVRVYSGLDQTALYTVWGNVVHDGFGSILATVGDLDEDGVPDFLAGNGAHPYGKAISAASGAVLYEFQTSAPISALAAFGDQDADGVEDFLVGSAQDDSAGMDAGRVWLLSGADGSTITTFEGTAAGQKFGDAVASAGDVDQDGTLDWIAGAPGDATAGPDAGAAFLYSGSAGVRLYTFTGAAGDELGASVAGGLDANGDGRGDLAISSPSLVLGNLGQVRLHAGSDLYLNSIPREPLAGGSVTWETGRGQAGGPYAIFLLAVNGSPFLRLLVLGNLDPQGTSSLPLSVSPNAAGFALTLRGFAFDAGGKLVQSSDEIMSVP